MERMRDVRCGNKVYHLSSKRETLFTEREQHYLLSLTINTRQSLDGGSATKQEHGGNDDIGAEGEEEEGEVCRLAPACAYDFAHGVGGWRDVLEGDGEDAEE